MFASMELVKMRYEKGRKEATHQRIVEVASREFRKGGIAASGLAGIMQEADLTIGAFYPNFASKAELVTETLAYTLDLQLIKMKEVIEKGGGLEAGIRSYLNKDHLTNPQRGCPSAALLPEIARQEKETRSAYKNGLLPFIAMLAEHLHDDDAKVSKNRALVLFSLLVGTLQIARAIPDPALAESILKNGIEAALNFAAGSDRLSRVAEPAAKSKTPRISKRPALPK